MLSGGWPPGRRASTDTLAYLGTTDAVVRIANAGGSGTTTDSLLDAAGSRLGTKVGSADPAWLLPDLHGNTAGAFDAAGGGIVDALRYDGYGLTLAAWNATSNSTPNRDWKYQGRLDLSPDAADDDVASAQPLYDFGAREYSPSAGAFTSLDSVLGSAQAPWQLNRYLYAAANPATLVDPDGHATCSWGPEDCHSLLVAGKETRPYGYQAPPAAEMHDSRAPATTAGSEPPVQVVPDAVPVIYWPLNPVLTPLSDVDACAVLGWESSGRCRTLARDQAGGACMLSIDPSCVRHALGDFTESEKNARKTGDAIVGGVCDATICGIAYAVTHPAETIDGLVRLATCPGCVVADDLTTAWTAIRDGRWDDALRLGINRATTGVMIVGGLKGVRGGGKTPKLGFTEHGADQLARRGVRTPDALDAFRNPLRVSPITLDDLGRPAQVVVGARATIVINPYTLEIITGYPTHSRIFRRLTSNPGGN